jgi:hypothetical protein
MQKLELDWAADETPAERADEVGFESEAMRVEFNDRPGPSGWPTVRVYAWALEGEQEYVAGMRIAGWLQDVYGADEDEADELAGMAVEA